MSPQTRRTSEQGQQLFWRTEKPWQYAISAERVDVCASSMLADGPAVEELCIGKRRQGRIVCGFRFRVLLLEHVDVPI